MRSGIVRGLQARRGLQKHTLNHELRQNVSSYAVTWIFFPVIGLVMGLFGVALVGAGLEDAQDGLTTTPPPG